MANLSEALADGFGKANIHHTVLKPPVVPSLWNKHRQDISDVIEHHFCYNILWLSIFSKLNPNDYVSTLKK